MTWGKKIKFLCAQMTQWFVVLIRLGPDFMQFSLQFLNINPCSILFGSFPVKLLLYLYLYLLCL
jgi:hypothetical protein